MAVGLGVCGYALNAIDVSLLTEESPDFLLGGIAVLAAFVWLGPLAGVVAGVIALGDSLARFDLIGTATLVYVLEGWAVSATLRWTGSLVLSTVLFWLLAGWAYDLAVYRWAIGLSQSYVTLLFAKQLLGGALNALCLDVVLEFAQRQHWARLSAPLGEGTIEYFTRRTLLLAVAALVVLMGLLGTRFAFREEVTRATLAQHAAAQQVGGRVNDYLGARERELSWLANDITIAREKGDDWPTALVTAFHAQHAEFLNIGVVDADGTNRVMSPSTGSLGQPLSGGSVATRSYFRDARDRKDVVFAPLILGALHVQAPQALEPIVIVAHPMLGRGGAFLGLVFGAVPTPRIEAILPAGLTDATQVATLLDQDRHVIASTGQRLAPGTDLVPALPARNDYSHTIAGFRFYPPAESSMESRLKLDLANGVLLDIPRAHWELLIAVPATTLHAAIAPAIGWVLSAFVVAFAIAYGAAGYFGRALSTPISSASQVAHALAAREFDNLPAIAPGTSERIVELRELSDDMRQLGVALREHQALTTARQADLEARFRATFDQAAVGLAHSSADGQLTLVNERLAAIIGRSRESIVGAGVTDFLHPDDVEAARRDRRLLASGEVSSVTGERRIRRVDGTLVPVQVTLSVARDASGTPKFFISVVQDISERKRLEAGMLQAQKMESVGRLAGGVAHDFNNLMTAIMGYAEMLRDDLAEDDRRRHDAEQILRAVKRATELTARLLAFARRQVVQPEVMDLNEVIERADNMLRRLIGEHISLVMERAPALWSVRADAAQMEQVLVNLVLNARDALARGGTITVRSTNVAAADAGLAHDVVEVSVHDTGTGLTPEAREHLFEPFFTTKPPSQGTGLGLATCYGIVTQAGGTIDVQSEPGRGTTFMVRLPRADGRVTPRQDDAAGPRRATGSGTILLVEDESAVASLAVRALSRAGYRVLTASNGEEALTVARASATPVDLLLTDVVMPVMGGIELAKTLEAERPGLRVLLMSGYVGSALDEAGALPSGWPLIGKPFDTAGLCRRVAEVLAGG